jgi:hypothetical protein
MIPVGKTGDTAYDDGVHYFSCFSSPPPPPLCPPPPPLKNVLFAIWSKISKEDHMFLLSLELAPSPRSPSANITTANYLFPSLLFYLFSVRLIDVLLLSQQGVLRQSKFQRKKKFWTFWFIFVPWIHCTTAKDKK